MNEDVIFEYATKLSRYIKIGATIIGIVFVVFLVIFFICWKVGCLKDKFVRVVLLLFLISIPVLYFTSVFPYFSDVKNQSYERYDGEFYVDQYYRTSGSASEYIFIQLPDETSPKRYNINGLHSEIQSRKTYNGYFVYGKRSKTIVEINIYNNT